MYTSLLYFPTQRVQSHYEFFFSISRVFPKQVNYLKILIGEDLRLMKVNWNCSIEYIFWNKKCMKIQINTTSRRIWPYYTSFTTKFDFRLLMLEFNCTIKGTKMLQFTTFAKIILFLEADENLKFPLFSVCSVQPIDMALELEGSANKYVQVTFNQL